MRDDDIQALIAMFGMVTIFGIVGIVMLVAFAINVAITWFLYDTLNRIPAEHRKQDPGLVWLLLVPMLSVVWNFMVWPKIAQSFRTHFEARGRYENGDCGEQIAMIYCVGGAVSLALGCIGQIPFIGIIGLLNLPLAMVNLVMLILLIVKFADLKKQLPAAA
jgi:cytochrome bd-type quinol oxidase subunit 2